MWTGPISGGASTGNGLVAAEWLESLEIVGLPERNLDVDGGCGRSFRLRFLRLFWPHVDLERLGHRRLTLETQEIGEGLLKLHAASTQRPHQIDSADQDVLAIDQDVFTLMDSHAS